MDESYDAHLARATARHMDGAGPSGSVVLDVYRDLVGPATADGETPCALLTMLVDVSPDGADVVGVLRVDGESETSACCAWRGEDLTPSEADSACWQVGEDGRCDD